MRITTATSRALYSSSVRFGACSAARIDKHAILIMQKPQKSSNAKRGNATRRNHRYRKNGAGSSEASGGLISVRMLYARRTVPTDTRSRSKLSRYPSLSPYLVTLGQSERRQG